MRRFITSPIGILIVVVLFGSSIVYGARMSGYHIDRSLQFVQTASVYIATSHDDVLVYVDDSRKKTETNGLSSIEVKGVASGRHSVIVVKDRYRPWVKIISVGREGEPVSISPFLVPDSPTISPLALDNPELLVAQKRLGNVSIPSASAPKTSEDKFVSIWVSGRDVFARFNGEGGPPPYFCTDDLGCVNEKIVHSAIEPIHTLDFYKDRNDVVLVAEGGMISIIEVDTRNPQNAYTIYQGFNAYFSTKERGVLYIKDGNFFFTLSLL
jgi:hypothetical protein